jgi:hypothetical protein
VGAKTAAAGDSHRHRSPGEPSGKHGHLVADGLFATRAPLVGSRDLAIIVVLGDAGLRCEELSGRCTAALIAQTDA